MSTLAIELIIALVLIVANGVFAMSEAALLAARKTRLQQFADDGDPRAKAALKLAEDPNGFLATVQIFITLIGIFTGAFSGVTLSRPLADTLSQIAVLAPYAESLAFAIVIVLTTYVSLIIGELAPKVLALNAPERITLVVARPMRLLARLTSPLVWILDRSTTLIVRLLGMKANTEGNVTEEEIKVMIDQGAQSGMFAEVERHIVEHVFRLGDLNVGALMTPRTDVVWLDINDPPEVLREMLINNPYWRYPVGQSTLDNVIGVVDAHTLFLRMVKGESVDIRALMHAPLYVPETRSALKLLEELRTTGQEIALVIDEYGGLQGLITLHDVLQEIIGDAIQTPTERNEPDVIRRADGSILLDGMLPIDRVKQVLKIKALPDDDEGNYQTLSGFVMMQLGHIPISSETFESNGWHFEIVDMDGRRVDKVLARTSAAPRQKT